MHPGSITAGLQALHVDNGRGPRIYQGRWTWRTPQTHRHHVVGRRTLLDGITCCIAFAENGLPGPWTACNTTDTLNHRTLRRSHARSSVEVTNRGHHLTMSGLAPSLTAAGPGRSTVSAQHHPAAARWLTGPYLCPCELAAGEPTDRAYSGLQIGVKSGPLVSSS